MSPISVSWPLIREKGQGRPLLRCWPPTIPKRKTVKKLKISNKNAWIIGLNAGPKSPKGPGACSKKKKPSLKPAPIRFELITLFPETFEGFLGASLIAKAIKKGLLAVHSHNPRDFAPGGQVDDRPYGGGPGMVLMPEPIRQTLRYITQNCVNPKHPKPAAYILSPRGERLTPRLAQRLAREERLILLAGHYEGIDERVRPYFDGEISIGDYVTMGGETPAMVILETVSRYVPGVIHDPGSTREESLSIRRESSRLLEWPQFTRPASWRSQRVPRALLSGNHAKIKAWRVSQALEKTRQARRDLIK